MTRLPPPEVIAQWPEPNYVDPEERGDALLIVELTFLPLALICLALRLYVRLVIVRKTWWDDWLMVGAAVFGTAVTICVILATQLYGWNLHVWDLQPWQIVQGRQVSIAAQTLFLFASGLVKLSILCSYLRIAPYGSWFRHLTWATIVIVFSLIWIFLVVLWTQCIPASYYWRLSTASADHCIDEWPPLAGQTISTIVTDFIVYVLPMPTLWRLSLPLFQRVILMVLFGLGVIVVVAGGMRTYWAHHVTMSTFDVTWEGFELWIWTAVEVSLGIICGCVPVLRRLLPASLSGSKYGNGQSAPAASPLAPPTIGSSYTRRPAKGPDSRAVEDGEEEMHVHQLGVMPAKATPPVSIAWMPIQDDWGRSVPRRDGDSNV